jgi:hypothetical protein
MIKCDICGKEVNLEKEIKEYPEYWVNTKSWSINAAIFHRDEASILHGHRVCLENVNNKVIIPARLHLFTIGRNSKKEIKVK